MEKISIKSTTSNIFRTQGTHQEQKHSNPFGLSFRGNILQADVFSSSKPKEHNEEHLLERIANRGRAFKSTVVGGINNFNNHLQSRFNNGINKIVSFGKRIGNSTRNFWKKANDTNLTFDFKGLTDGLRQFSHIGERKESYKVKDLAKKPVSELEAMLRHELEEIKG